jgi:transcriptional regulator with XRE-family HTH domain
MDDAPLGSDPIASRIRELRRVSGASLRALASAVSQRLSADATRASATSARSDGVSASYLSLIETGRKVPDLAIATAIAAALGDDPDLYAAWIALRKRADLATAMQATRTLTEALERTGSGDGTAIEPRARSVTGVDAIASASSHATARVAARLRVPVIREGDDPGDALRPTCPVAEWLRLDLARLPERVRERLARPVAWRVDADARHVGDRFAKGAVALLVRELLPLDRREAHAVRVDGRVVLRHVLWNGRQLVLLPTPESHDFELVEAADEARLRARVLGMAWPIEG